MGLEDFVKNFFRFLSEKELPLGKQPTVKYVSAFTLSMELFDEMEYRESRWERRLPKFLKREHGQIDWDRYVHHLQQVSTEDIPGGISRNVWNDIISRWMGEKVLISKPEFERRRREEAEVKSKGDTEQHFVVYGVGNNEIEFELLPYAQENSTKVPYFFIKEIEALRYIRAMRKIDEGFKGCKPIPLSTVA